MQCVRAGLADSSQSRDIHCCTGSILVYNILNRPHTALVDISPSHHCYRHAVVIRCVSSVRLPKWSTAISISLEIVNAKDTSHAKQKPRLSSVKPKDRFAVGCKKFDWSGLVTLPKVV
jgi:hypothetical protein